MELSKLEKIPLPNRDGADLYFLETSPESGLFRLVCDKNHKYVLDYACITMCEDNQTIYSFDPSGGPFLNLGYKLGDKEIKSIFILDNETIFMIKK